MNRIYRMRKQGDKNKGSPLVIAPGTEIHPVHPVNPVSNSSCPGLSPAWLAKNVFALSHPSETLSADI
jgi:hypothetical protein